MAGLRPSAHQVLQPVRDILRVHLRTIVPIGILVVTGLVVLAFLAGVYAQVIGVTAYQALVASISSIETWTVAVALMLAPLALLALCAGLIWAGVATQVASTVFDKQKAGMPTAVGRAFRRAPRALAVILATLAAVLGAIVAAPAFLIIGIAGLVMRRGRREQLLPMAIPFGVAVLVLVRWSLALPAVWLDGCGVRAALTESSRRVRGRGPTVAAILLAALIVNLGITEGVVALVPDPVIQLGVRIAALIMLGAIPFVAATVLYRSGSDAKPAPLPGPVTRRARLAAAVALSLVVPMAIGTVPAAQAVAGTTVTLSQFATESLTGEDFRVIAVVAGVPTPTGSVRLEAQPAVGPAVDLGTHPLDTSGIAEPDVGASLPAGDYQLIGYYAGDGVNTAATSSPLAHTVTDPSVTISVTSIPGASGDTATLTVTVSPNAPAVATPAGTVSVQGGVGYALNGSGVTTIPVNIAVTGTRELTVAYSPASYFAANSTLYTVPRLATTLTVFDTSARTGSYGDVQNFDGRVSSGTGTTATGTVELVDSFGTVVASDALASGIFAISTTAIRAQTGALVLQYGGDASHAASDNAGSPIAATIAKVNGKPVITPVSPAIGDSVSLIATLPARGDGATGTVTFETAAGAPYSGPITVVGGVATFPWVPTEISTSLRAVYSGDSNFTGATSDVETITADRAAVAVTIDDPGPVTYGDLFTLTARVKVGATGLPHDHTVAFEFLDSTGTPIVRNLALTYDSTTKTSSVSLDFCARTTGCPAGYEVLGAADRDIVADYGADTRNYAGEDTYEYRPAAPATTTSLVVTPSPGIVFGSGVNLKATITSANPGVTPSGVVSFYGVQPDGSLSFIKMVAVTAGVAEWTTSSGDDASTQLVWPQNKVKAVYDPNGAVFQGSSAEVAVTLGRMGTYLAVNVGTPVLNTSATVTVTLSHDPGTNADYRGFVTITSDTGATCTRYVASGTNSVSCPFTWTTNGAHKVTTSYSNTDPVYLPVADADTPFAVGSVVGTPVLHAGAPTTALVGDNVTVTWSLTDVSMTGDVTVWGDGIQWCRVAVATRTCTGQFGIASATGVPVDIRVRYDGDANWHGVEETRQVRVTRCAVLDVRGNDSTLGSVSVDTAPNCGASGYLPGTIVQVTATPKAPAEFGYWLGYRPPAANLVLVASTATDRFVVTTDTQTWVHVAQFRVPCSAVTASVTDGLGGISVYPASNCTTPSGAAGYLYGTPVTIYPDGRYNAYYDEPDAFWAFGTLPFGAVRGTDSAGRPLVRLTVTAPAVIPVTFGPVCRTVTVVFEPATTGDVTELSPAADCLAPTGQGYLRGTEVTVHAESADPTLAISAWSLDGVPAAQLDPADDPVVVIDRVAPVLTATLVHCYAVDVTIDGVPDRFGEPTGEVRIDGTACPDGSDRYLGGTKVTITPRILTAGTLFNGWNETRIQAVAPDSGETGDVTAGAMVIAELDRDVHLSAGFFEKTACSRLTDAGAPGLLSFEFTGCGPGYYLDTRKQQAALENVPAESLTSPKYFNTLNVDVDQDGPLGVYVTIKGDTPDCNGSLDREGFENLGLVTANRLECKAAGDITIQADVCQPVVTHAEFTVKGREGTYGADSMPGTFYLTSQDGTIQEVSGFQWGQAMPVKPVGDQFAEALAPSGPCGATTNLFAPNTDILLYASAPSSGFEFDGWTGFGNAEPILPSPMHRLTNDDETALSTGAAYTVTCHTVTFGPGIHIDGDAPRCPGSSETDNSFIAGVAIKVRADYWLGDKNIEKFTSGVVGGQIYEDPATLDWVTYAYVDSDKHVAALYQNRTQRIGTEIAKSMKVLAGVIAVVAPVILGMLFPPVGIFFGVVGTAAGLTGLIPGGDKIAAVFDLVNPTKISACVARWGFNKPGSPGGGNYGAMISTGKTAATAVFTSKDVLIRNIGPLGVGGAALSIGYGLYDAGIGGANLVGPQSVEELADRSTITGCLDQQWRILGSNISGTQGSSPASGTQQQPDAEPQPTGVSVPPSPSPVPTP
jgi:hypothetical protein